MSAIKKLGLPALRVLYVILGALLVFDWQSLGLDAESAARIAGAVMMLYHGVRLFLQAVGIDTGPSSTDKTSSG